MFYREENPELFDLVLDAYNSLDASNILNKTRVKKTAKQLDVLTDEMCLSIKELDFKKSAESINSLKGIENLKNLESLRITGYSADSYFIALKQLIYTPFSDDIKDKMAIELYNHNQVEDIAPLYSLKNLKLLDLSEQRNIKEIDFASLTNLKKCSLKRCTNLETIKSLDSLESLKDDQDERVAFIFAGCTKLTQVDGFENLLKNLNYKEHKLAKVFFPTTTFMFLTKDNDYFKNNNYANAESALRWTELSLETGKMINTTKTMRSAKNYINNIVKKITKSNKYVLEDVISIYDWIAQNIKYDYISYDIFRNMTYTETRQNVNIQDSINNRVASSIYGLNDKKAICSGISNLFNLMMASIGMVAVPVAVNSDEGTDDLIYTHPNHQISAMYVNGKKYYLDPTANLYTKKEKEKIEIDKLYNKETKISRLKVFLLSKEEMMKQYGLTIFDRDVENAEKISNTIQSFNDVKVNLMPQLARAMYGEDLKNIYGLKDKAILEENETAIEDFDNYKGPTF